MEISSAHSHGQTVRARELKFETRFTTPNLSCVMCHVYRVTCHMSNVNITKIYKKGNGQSGGDSRWRVCYQRAFCPLCPIVAQGLPRLVYLWLLLFSNCGSLPRHVSVPSSLSNCHKMSKAPATFHLTPSSKVEQFNCNIWIHFQEKVIPSMVSWYKYIFKRIFESYFWLR